MFTIFLVKHWHNLRRVTPVSYFKRNVAYILYKQPNITNWFCLPKPQFMTEMCSVLYFLWAQIVRLYHELGYFRWFLIWSIPLCFINILLYKSVNKQNNILILLCLLTDLYNNIFKMKLNKANKLQREEIFSAFPNGSIFPSPNQLFQNSNSILLLIQKSQTFSFYFRTPERECLFFFTVFILSCF